MRPKSRMRSRNALWARFAGKISWNCWASVHMIDCNPWPNHTWSAISGSNGTHRLSTLPALISLTSLLVTPYPIRSSNGAGAASRTSAVAHSRTTFFLGAPFRNDHDSNHRHREIRASRERQQHGQGRHRQQCSKSRSRATLLSSIPDPETESVRDRQERTELIGVEPETYQMLAALGRHHRQRLSRCHHLPDDQQIDCAHQRPDRRHDRAQLLFVA